MTKEEIIKKLVDDYEEYLKQSSDELVQKIYESNDFVIR